MLRDSGQKWPAALTESGPEAIRLALPNELTVRAEECAQRLFRHIVVVNVTFLA